MPEAFRVSGNAAAGSAEAGRRRRGLRDALWQPLMIVTGEHRRQHPQRAQVQLSALHHTEHDRVVARQSCGADAQAGLALRHVQRLGAVGEHRAVPSVAVQPPRIHLTEVPQQPCGSLSVMGQQCFPTLQ
jgi:hypothetical protein